MEKYKELILRFVLVFSVPVIMWGTKDQVIADLGPYLLPWPFKGTMSAFPVFFVFWLMVCAFWVGECCPRILAFINEEEDAAKDQK